jgi:hypothetical protein
MPKRKLNTKKLRETALDKKQPIKKRREAAMKLRDNALNPLPESEFNPDTFEGEAAVGFTAVIPRKRKEPPRRLPCKGMKPKEIMEGQRVGCFESKQDLYLLVAWLSNRVTDLEDEVNTLRGG